jgi:hypothetical protein
VSESPLTRRSSRSAFSQVFLVGLVLSFAGCSSQNAFETSVTPTAGGWLQGSHASVWIPPGATNQPLTIRMEEDGQHIALSPSVAFSRPIWLGVETAAASINTFDGEATVAVPSISSNGVRIALLHGQSEWGEGRPLVPCDADGDCFVQEVVLPPYLECWETMTRNFEEWLLENHIKTHSSVPQYAAEGHFTPICQYPASLDAQITATQTTSQQWRVTIPPHSPKLDTYVYLPALLSMERLSHCSITQANDLYARIRAHEMEHVRINRSIGPVWHPAPIDVLNVPTGTAISRIKVKAYMSGCFNDYFVQYILPLHQAFHASTQPVSLGIQEPCLSCQVSPPPSWSFCEAYVHHGLGPARTTCVDQGPPRTELTSILKTIRACDNVRSAYSQWTPGCSACVQVSCTEYRQFDPLDSQFLEPWCQVNPGEYRCAPGFCDSVPNNDFCP